MAMGRGVSLVLIAVVVGVESFAGGEVRWVELLTALAGAVAAVLLFGRFPAAVVACAVAAVVVLSLVPGPAATSPVRIWPYPAVACFSYLAGRWCDGRPVPAAVAGVLAAGLPVGVLVDVSQRGGFGVLYGLYGWFLQVLVVLAVAGGPWLIGRYRRQRAELHTAGLERAALLERNRIAREMHDSLGHELELVALRAAALEVAPALDDDVRARAGEMRAGVTAAAERLREIVGLLGDPVPDLGRLVARATSAGQDVTLTVSGELSDSDAVYRVVREGLTNAARHAPGAPVTVDVVADGHSTTVTIGNPASAPGSGPGFGIAGLREIGEVTAGIRGERFVLTVVVPRAAARRPVRQRPRVWRLVRVPLAAGGVVLVLALGLYLLTGTDNRLDPAVYQRLSIGQSEEDVEKVLPRFQMLGDPAPAPRPPAADCRRYWATVQTDARLFYRLCFADERLVVKETVPRSAVSR
ncbi:sensor histidine kinase [Amycolatopsis japonica]|uniref:sensor histidine kinase n=1 Tax=Amycolatopsis japonica TaxID=208439 RepID=UPI0038144568